jgi:D-beta-D-heptose 7-phosphate kinase / D-beta-D-heptose 1-phosphate adenosyltransferase
MTSLSERITALGSPRILIVGDLILDEYVLGDVQRISPEAPIPVLEVRREDLKLGGAGNVAANVAAMGGRATVLGGLGGDDAGKRLLQLLGQVGIDTSPVLVVHGRPTTIKSRHMAGPQQMLRVDREDRSPLAAESEAAAIAYVRTHAPEFDLLVLSDYGKGFLSNPLIAATIAAARAAGRRVLVDPKGIDYTRYRGASVVTPNRAEAEQASRHAIRSTAAGTPEVSDLLAAGEWLLDQCDLEAAVITLGKDGVFFVGRNDRAPHVIPTLARQVYDVTGAGDTVIAHLGLHLAAGASLEDSVKLANAAAGIVVAKLGTATVRREEVLDAFAIQEERRGKIVRSPAELDRLLADLRGARRTVVFTNGVFDILHAGHLKYLREARARGDVLVVGVNDDESVRRLKGPRRPINILADRMALLAGLEVVDAVVPFPDDTPLALIQRLNPDVLVKGEDWADKGVVGREWVEAHGGRVVLIKLEPDRSTSGVIRRIVELHSPGGTPDVRSRAPTT